MIRIGILGNIGSGKSYVAKSFRYPVFNADLEVSKIYKNNKKIFLKLNKILSNFIHSFPINKNEMSKAILANKSNLNKIVKVVHKEVRKRMNVFMKKNKNKRIVILDIPLLLENKINNNNDILVFVESKKIDILKRLKKRKNFNKKLYKNLKIFNYHPVIKRKNLNLLLKMILQINLLKSLLRIF